MLGERIASQSEVIRAIVSGYSQCYGVPHLLGDVLVGACQPGEEVEALMGGVSGPVQSVSQRSSTTNAAA